MKNRVKKKIVLYIDITLASPLCISMGGGELTDQDVIRDYDGKPFVPGSSLAGAMRAYLSFGKEQKCIFGYSDSDSTKSDGKMSSIFVSDLRFDGDAFVKVRDSVALSEGKTAITGAKFDMEIVDTGAKGYFMIELVVREKDNEAEMMCQLRKVFHGWNLQEIRLGAKKTRGYGEIQIKCIKSKVYTAENISEYEKAYDRGYSDQFFEDTTAQWMSQAESDSQYLTMELPLKLEGGISIRQYAVKKGEPDFVHVTASGKPVIPGTSFAGAIRQRMGDILDEIGAKNKKEILEQAFGYVKQSGRDSKAKKSDIVVNECIIEGAKELTMVRNGISRFESGAKTGALFKERSFVGGTTTLTIRIKRQECCEAVAGLLLLTMKDIQNGYLPVGGQTAVGRGIFTGNGEIRADGKAVDEEKYFSAACALIVGR